MPNSSTRMYTRLCLLFCAMTLLASGLLLGQERRTRPLEVGVRQQERRPPIKGGVRQRDEVPDEYSVERMMESSCRDSRNALDLYRRAAANPELVSSPEWQGVDDRLYQGMASCLECPAGSLKVYVELLRQLEVARLDKSARPELYRRVVSLENGNEPARGPVSLQAYDQALLKWKQKIQETLDEAEVCYKQSCTDTLRAVRDADDGGGRMSGGVFEDEVRRDGEGRRRRTGVSENEPPPIPPPLPGRVERNGGTPKPSPTPVTNKKPPANDKTGPPPWAIAIAGGVFLATAEGTKDLMLPGVATGVVCTSAVAIKHQIAEAHQWELYSWDHYKDLQGLDRELMVEVQRHMERVDDYASQLRNEPMRHADAVHALDQQQLLADQRYREAMKAAERSTDPYAREIAQGRYNQDKDIIKRAHALEESKHAGNLKSLGQDLPQGEANIYRKNIERAIERSNLPAESKSKLKAEAESLRRLLENDLTKRRETAYDAVEKARTLHAAERAAEAVRRQHLTDFQREWEAESRSYQQTGQDLNDQWQAEEQRHNLNPFKTEAENQRHGEALARINAKMRCEIANHLARRDEIRLKYQVW